MATWTERNHCEQSLIDAAFQMIIQLFFSSAVPPGSGAFQMPTRPSSSASSSSSSSSSAAAAASTLRGGRANLSNASVTFSLFWHEASLG